MRLSVSVAIIVLLAGCGGIADTSDQATVSITPAEVAVGMSPIDLDHESDRIANPAHLASRHGLILENESYTVNSTLDIEFPRTNRSGRWHLTGRFKSNGRFLVETVRIGSVFEASSPVYVSMYSDGRGVVESTSRENATTASLILEANGNPVPTQSVLSINPAFEGQLATVYASSSVQEMESVSEMTSETESIRLVVTGPADRSRSLSLGSVTTVHQFSAAIVLTECGFVKRYRLQYTGSYGEEPVQVVRTVEYSSVGKTSFDTPSWASEVLGPTNKSVARMGTGTNP